MDLILRISMMESGRVGTPPAKKEAIQCLPEVQITQHHCKFNEQTGALDHPRCTICLEELTEKAVIMPCNHMFNRDCIDQWLKIHNQCPVCRYELPTDD